MSTTKREARRGRAAGRESERSAAPDPFHDPLQESLVDPLAGPVQRLEGAPAARSSAAPAGVLPDPIRLPMQQVVGTDLSDVTVGESRGAADMGAIAYTRGKDVRFAPGQLDTTSREGLETLGHELTHVKQQAGGGVHATTQAKGVPVNDDAGLEAEADRVGKAAAAAVSNPVATRGVSTDASGSAPAQRKVYIKGTLWGWNEKTKDDKPDTGEKGRTVGEMIGDRRTFYFRNKTEMYGYAKKETDNIGYVDKAKTFVRLHKGKLIVLGEHHSKKTLADIVAATGTEKYRYEGYTGDAGDQPDNASLTAAVKDRTSEMDDKFGKEESKRSHEGESFLPKVARGLATIDTDPDVHGGSLESKLLRWALLYASEADGKTGIRQLYDKHADVYAKAAEDLNTKLVGSTVFKDNNLVLAAFLKEFHAHYLEHLEDEKAKLSKKDQRLFDEKYGDDKHQYPREATNEAERGRDMSMLAHINQAKDDGDLLYGMGNIHRERLADVLDAKSVKHMTVEEYLAAQGKK